MIHRLLLVCLALLPWASVLAALPVTSTYEIEVVVFENRLGELEGSEYWRRKPVVSNPTVKEELITPGEKPPPDSALSNVVALLESSGRHPVLAHYRWQQSAEAKSISKPVRISNATGTLDGSLRFYLSRFLVAEVNLTWREPVTGGLLTPVTETEAIVHQLNEPRRIKVSETHYFDHPKLGALIRVTPVKAPVNP